MISPTIISTTALIAAALLVGNNVAAHRNTHDPLQYDPQPSENFLELHHERVVQDHRLMTGVARCSTDNPTQSDLRQDKERVDGWLATSGCASTTSCPPLDTEKQTRISVYWHNIQNGYGTGGLTDDKIASSMNVLNDAFAGTGFSFHVAEIITTDDNEYYNAPYGSAILTTMKYALHKGDASTLNIYSIARPGVLGWSTPPIYLSDYLQNDGVVIDLETVPGGEILFYNKGMTLVHEVGHWMGLYHVFQGGCSGGDEVDDTPPQDTPTSGCPVGKSSCCLSGQEDSIENYMDYSDDACMTSFTPGQIRRMKVQWKLYRAADRQAEELVEEPGFSIIKTALNVLDQLASYFNGP